MLQETYHNVFPERACVNMGSLKRSDYPPCMCFAFKHYHLRIIEDSLIKEQSRPKEVFDKVMLASKEIILQ